MLDRIISFTYSTRSFISFFIALACSAIIISFLLNSTKQIANAAITAPSVQEMTASLASLPEPAPEPEPTPEPEITPPPEPEPEITPPEPDPIPEPVKVKKPVQKPKPKPVVKPVPKPVVKKKPTLKPKPVVKPVKKPVTTPVKTAPVQTHNTQQNKQASAKALAAAKAAEKSKKSSASYGGLIKDDLEKRKKYPTGREASQNKPKGTVSVWLIVSRDGTVLSYGIEKSSKSNLLDREAKKLIRRAKFPPFPDDAFPNESNHRFIIHLHYEKK